MKAAAISPQALPDILPPQLSDDTERPLPPLSYDGIVYPHDPEARFARLYAGYPSPPDKLVDVWTAMLSYKQNLGCPYRLTSLLRDGLIPGMKIPERQGGWLLNAKQVWLRASRLRFVERQRDAFNPLRVIHHRDGSTNTIVRSVWRRLDTREIINPAPAELLTLKEATRLLGEWGKIKLPPQTLWRLATISDAVDNFDEPARCRILRDDLDAFRKTLPERYNH